jgi:outer membrane protein assembly factor BamA
MILKNFKMRCYQQQNMCYSIVVAILLMIGNTSVAQSGSKDIKDILSQFKKNPDTEPASEITAGKTYYSLLPFVGYGPANGFVVGGAVSLARLFGNPPTSVSSGMINCQVTTQRQFITNARTKIYLAENKWFLQGDWRLLFFTQTTYGLGIINSMDPQPTFQINNIEETEVLWGEPMKYNQIRFHQNASRQLGNSSFYAGLGIAIDQHYKIVDKRLDTIPGSPDFFITSHYTYSVKNNFNPEKYGTNGIIFTVLTDKRDNISNSYKGYYASVSLRNNIKIGNNSQQSTQFLYEVMYYLGLSKQNPRHVLALWSWGSFTLKGNVPYLALPAIGWDTYNRSGRGFIQGRYRGLNMLYNEAEYRFQISNNGLLGGVLFANVTQVSSYTQKLFEKAALGFGGGIRLQFDKLSRTNLGVDYGIGTDRSSGLYFNLQETF